MKNKISLETFNAMPVSKAVRTNAIPAMITMLMFLVYNLADTLFIGMTHDDYQVAAISLTSPLFMMFTAFSTILGMGGTSVISRAMGKKENGYAKKVSAFCFWSAVAVGVIIGLIFILFAKPILLGLGASTDTYDYAHNYLVLIAFCGPFCMISNTFSKVLMRDGQPKKAMFGSMLGNLINCILDPILILALKMNITGAALATLISNIIGAAYYLFYFRKNKSTDLSISPKDFSVSEKIPANVLSIGIPAALGPLVMGISVMFINNKMSGYSDMALAGIGVSLKITMITGMLSMGIGQGVQPL